MMGVDDVRSEGIDNFHQVLGPGPFVDRELVDAEAGEPGALIRHDITHARHREIKRWFAELQRMDSIGAQSADRSLGPFSGNAGDDALLVAGLCAMPDQSIERDAASGQ